MEKAIIDMFGAVVEYFALFAFLWIFFKLDDRRRGWRWLCHISMPILFFLFSQYVENMYLRPFLFIFCSWLIAVGFQGNWGQRIFSVSVFQIILIFLEITVSFAAFVFWLPQNESAYLAINIIMKTGTILIIGFLFLVSQKPETDFCQSFSTAYDYIVAIFRSISNFGFFLGIFINCHESAVFICHWLYLHFVVCAGKYTVILFVFSIIGRGECQRTAAVY